MLVHNYGLLWKEADGDWQGKTLWGHYAQDQSYETNFAAQRGIYALYDPQFKPVYIGQAGKGADCLFNRIEAHRWDRLRGRWTTFSWFGVCPLVEDAPGSETWVVDTSAAIETNVASTLNHLEAVLIAVAEPALNLQRGRFGEGVYHYNQTALSDFE